MISQIKLTNFKCFKDTHYFPLNKFNLLTGINGRGKSTLLQSLLLMKQTTDYDKTSNQLVLNGSCVQLGEFVDIKNAFASNENDVGVSFEIIANNKQGEKDLNKTGLQFYLKSNSKDTYVASIQAYAYDVLEGFAGLNKLTLQSELTDKQEIRKLDGDNYLRYIFSKDGKNYYDENSTGAYLTLENLIPNKINSDLEGNLNVFKHIQFISADRIGPRNYYEIQNVNKDFSWVGAKGENTASILLKKKDSEVHEALYLGEDTNTLLQQTEERLSFIFDGAKININTEGSVAVLTYNTKHGGERYKPSNVGFGYSYILPIVVAGLIAQSGEILIIENPEAHLHPRAQHKLTQFLAKVAATGVQIFVESHSEHILNALRICTIEQNGQEKILNNTDLSILYFQDNSTTPCVQIPIDEKGGIEEWPEGFFDQTDKDFKILFGF